MTSLHELQSAFVDGVLHDRTQGACALIAGNGLAPERRLAIYRNNAHQNFLNTLSAGFPVVARLGGEDWFRQTGVAYMRAHPSRSGDLHHIGERFPGFLRERLAATEFAYFADVAELEWAYQEVLVAAEEASLNVDALRSVAPHDYASLSFELRAASQLVDSVFPILAIWKANQNAPALTLPRMASEGTDADVSDSLPCRAEEGSGGGAPLLHLDAGPSRVLVIRRDDHVELRELGVAEFALLRAFNRGETFASAADSMLAEDVDADLGAVFARIVRLGVLSTHKLVESGSH